MDNVIVYHKNGCQQCRMTMRLMDKLSIMHTDVNIDDNEDIREQLIAEGTTDSRRIQADACRESRW